MKPPAVSRPTRRMACGSRSRASRSAAASSTPFALRTSASSTTRSARRRRSARRPARAIPATCVRRHGPARMAPAVRNLCAQTGVPGAIVDTYQYTTVAIGVINSGNTDLTPEEADTLTFGFVLRARVRQAAVLGSVALGGLLRHRHQQCDRADCRWHRVEQVLQPRRHQSDLRPGQPVLRRPAAQSDDRWCRHGRGAVSEPGWIAHDRRRRADRLEDSRRPRQPRSQHPRQLHRLVRNAAARGFGVAGVRGHDRRHAERRHPDSGLEDADVADVSAAELRRRRALAPPAGDEGRHVGHAAREPGAGCAVL